VLHLHLSERTDADGGPASELCVEGKKKKPLTADVSEPALHNSVSLFRSFWQQLQSAKYIIFRPVLSSISCCTRNSNRLAFLFLLHALPFIFGLKTSLHGHPLLSATPPTSHSSHLVLMSCSIELSNQPRSFGHSSLEAPSASIFSTE
jgi:hypothetical protein